MNTRWKERLAAMTPVADFTFNVKAGHCEYFATAMALLLRTRGTAARVVNGFQMGEYNDAADAYTVRQLNAHSWVEVLLSRRTSLGCL
ncbi:MAG: transglutaminase-like domain-containing protein [Pyrinomonadaceae bacterium]